MLGWWMKVRAPSLYFFVWINGEGPPLYLTTEKMWDTKAESSIRTGSAESSHYSLAPGLRTHAHPYKTEDKVEYILFTTDMLQIYAIV
jgi:hypothetical protein